MAQQIGSDSRTMRTCLLYEFLQGHKAADAYRNLCTVVGQDVISQPTAYRWFDRFNLEKYRSKTNLATSLDNYALRDALKAQSNATTREFSTTLGCNHKTIINSLHDFGYRKIVSTWYHTNYVIRTRRQGSVSVNRCFSAHIGRTFSKIFLLETRVGSCILRIAKLTCQKIAELG